MEVVALKVSLDYFTVTSQQSPLHSRSVVQTTGVDGKRLSD